MKKYLISAGTFIFPFFVFAHGEEEMEETGIGHQLEELSPLTHLNEGHWVAFILIIILWLSFVYTIYSLIKKFSKS